MSCIVLGGGLSTRMGQDKLSLNFGEGSLREGTLNRLSQLGEEIILVLRQGQTPPELCAHPKVKVAFDLYLGKGPLVGIYSGLKVSHDDYSLAVACDMPFLNIDLIRYLRTLAAGVDVVIPRIGDQVEPLHAVYSKSCLPHIEEMMREGISRVYQLLDRVKVRYVEADEIDRFDPEHLSWFNINTPADLERAKSILMHKGAAK